MKRYYDLNSYLRKIFGERVQKISLDAGLSCPNRDGTLSRRGCLYCDGKGSGTGAWITEGLTLNEQIHRARLFLRSRYKANKFIAYFQSFTNTYGPLHHLKSLYDEALAHEDMVGLAVATRPDCVNKEILTLLRGYQKDHLVWIEYGLQSAHDKTLNRINRGHDVACFEECVRMTRDFGLETCAHIILGLPGEDREMMRHTARFLSSLPVQGVKIHLLYLVQGTPLAESHGRGEFRCLDREAYADLVVDVLELLRPDMVIHRLTGDPPKNELVAPSWATDKTANLRLINEVLNQRNTWQGRLWKPSGVGNLR